MKNSLPEIFEAVRKAETTEEKKEILSKNYSVSLAACLRMAYDPEISFPVAPGLPEGYKFNDHPHASLESILRSLPPLVNHPNPSKAEKAWLRLLLPLSKDDVLLLTALKDKELDIGLSLPDVQEMFPTLLGHVSQEALEKAKAEKATTTEKVDNKVSEAPGVSVIPEDPYGDKYKPMKTEEDPSLPTPVSENPGTPGTEIEVEGLTLQDAEPELQAPILQEDKPTKKKPAPKKASSKKKD